MINDGREMWQQASRKQIIAYGLTTTMRLERQGMIGKCSVVATNAAGNRRTGSKQCSLPQNHATA